MPTENRPSTIYQHDHIEAIIDMVSVPRELASRIQAVLDAFHALDELGTPGVDDELRALLAQPAPPPQAEPIAWMVGITFWWSNEEAERDAAETGLPMVGLGPMVDLCQKQQSHPKVAKLLNILVGTE